VWFACTWRLRWWHAYNKANEGSAVANSAQLTDERCVVHVGDAGDEVDADRRGNARVERVASRVPGQPLPLLEAVASQQRRFADVGVAEHERFHVCSPRLLWCLIVFVSSFHVWKRVSCVACASRIEVQR
jgi:hypothetical protein